MREYILYFILLKLVKALGAKLNGKDSNFMHLKHNFCI